MNTRFTTIITICALALLLTGGNAFAHALWLNPDDHFPAVGQTVAIGIGWGHQFNADRTHEEVREGRVAEIWAITPNGETVPLTPVAADRYDLTIETAGVYLVAARIKPGVFTTTPQGRKWADKKGVENPIKCTAFNIEAKTVLVAGGAAQNPTGATGQPLELVPLANPADLPAGAKLPLRVMFDNQPLADHPVRAVFAGYPDVAPEGQPWAAEVVTNQKGEAVLPLDTAGYWMISLSHTIPYPDVARCDDQRYNASFTFQVR